MSTPLSILSTRGGRFVPVLAAFLLASSTIGQVGRLSAADPSERSSSAGKSKDIPKPARDLPSDTPDRVLASDTADDLFVEKISNKRNIDSNKLVHEILTRFETRLETLAKSEDIVGRGSDFPLPESNEAWWDGATSPMGLGGDIMKESLDGLYLRTLEHSEQIKVFADLPRIRETGIREARGSFDTELFASGLFRKDNEPIGSSLTTGGTGRFRETALESEAGLRKKVITGAEVRLAQEFDWLDNNSEFLQPNPQSRAKLSLSVTQPLLKFGGTKYNRSIMEIAKLDTKMALGEFLRQAESHLLEVNRAYWSLYLARALYLEKARLSDETGKVVGDLDARKDLDTVASQQLRAKSAAAERSADLVRAQLAVRNAESRIKALVNDPGFYSGDFVEIIPGDDPRLTAPIPGLRESAAEAIYNRPEIAQALYQLKSTVIRLKMQRNEVLPQIDLVLKASLGGLEGGKQFDPAYARQFDSGTPSYAGGLVFTMPLEGNFDRARLERRKLEVRQQISQVNVTIETVLLEVQVALREVATSQRELRAKFAAAKAASAELEDLYSRKALDAELGSAPAGSSNGSGSSAGSGGDVAGYLERLLDSQERNAEAREEFLQSVAVMNVAIANLERSKGTLLRYEDISVERVGDDNYDQLALLRLLKEMKERDHKHVTEPTSK